jgi:HD-GYP domain-containing protein (c-di-GMP phosphodiesterase class II)
MAIADIFEALSASDRPYKKGKKLSECLKIMSYMKKDNHIDPDLFDIFIKNKVYLKYAEEFLDPEQIDDINEQEVIAYLN